MSQAAAAEVEVQAIPGLGVEVPSEQDRYVIVNDEGFLYKVDMETGEFVECVGHEGAPSEFSVNSVESADWVMTKMREADAQLAGLCESQNLELKAIQAQWERKIKASLQRCRYLRWRFKNQLIQFTQGILHGMPQKSKVYLGGTVGTRTKQPGLTILNMERATEWARLNVPDAVTVAKLHLPESQKEREAALDWLAENVPAGVTIEYGIAKKPITDRVKSEGRALLPEDAFEYPLPAQTGYVDTGVPIPKGIIVDVAETPQDPV